MGGASSRSERCSTDFAELQAKVRGLMTDEQFNELRVAFNEQQDTDGEINQQGFDKIMKKVNPGVNTAQLQLITPALYKAYDRDRSGKVNLMECVSICACLGNPNQKEKALEILFDVIDSDGDSCITTEEMSVFVEVIYNMENTSTTTAPDCSLQDFIKHVFEEMDQNKDGKISKEEFLKTLGQEGNNTYSNILYTNLQELFKIQ